MHIDHMDLYPPDLYIFKKWNIVRFTIQVKQGLVNTINRTDFMSTEGGRDMHTSSFLDLLGGL